MAAEDSLESTFTWKIENFSKLTAKTLTSDAFHMHGHQWYLKLFPKGNAKPHYLALYLAVANPGSLPSEWNIYAKFSLAGINQINDTLTVRKSTAYNFCHTKTDWGFGDILLLSELHDGTAGFVVHDVLIVEAQIAVKPRKAVSVKSETSVEHFANLFDDISKVVGTCSSSLVSTGKAESGVDRIEISHSLSLLNRLSDISFSGIPCSLRAELTSAFELLAQATCLPLDQASAIQDFACQYEELCRSYIANLAVLETSKQFFNSKDDSFSLLKMYSKSQMEIKNSIDKISKEGKHLGRVPREAKDSISCMFEEYGVIGKKAQVAKAEWDELVAKQEAVIGQKEKAEKELAAIETKWTNFISLFKAEAEGLKNKAEVDDLIVKDETRSGLGRRSWPKRKRLQ